jgi:diphosphomevalonate decarboxylase
MKKTYKASSDVALIKYWGKKDEKLRLPENGSVSMILNGLDTVTTVEFSDAFQEDSVVIQGESEVGEVDRVIKHLDRLRQVTGVSTKAKVFSQNTFPKGTGLSSSGSGFAALTYSATAALGLSLSEKELSILARQGSGTACRCVCGGFVEWKDGETSETSYSETLYSPEHMDIVDVVAVVSDEKKKVSSVEGHAKAQTSVFYQTRLQHIKQKIVALKNALQERNFTELGQIVENEALEFHSILLTSSPSLIAWYPGTIQVMIAVQAMREEGIEAYFTINTGFNVHVLTVPKYQEQVKEKLGKLSLVRNIIEAKVGNGPQELTEHLF